MSHLIVVGAGPSGLGCATALAANTGSSVELVDRIPVTGGEAGWDTPLIVQFTHAAEQAGVSFRLGATATAWRDGELLLAAPGRIERVPATHLFYAGGRRPATAADLRISGERPAGILPATVAEHLLTSGVALWKRALIIGNGPWAARIAHHIREYGGTVIATEEAADWADLHVPCAGGIDVRGRARVTGIRIDGLNGPSETDCDAIILAADPHPNRNVDGALDENAKSVTFVQKLTGETINDRYNAGRAIADAWIQSKTEVPHESQLPHR